MSFRRLRGICAKESLRIPGVVAMENTPTPHLNEMTNCYQIYENYYFDLYLKPNKISQKINKYYSCKRETDLRLLS